MSIAHTVRQGECLLTIANQYNISDWRSIFDHPSNEELQQKRRSPFILFPGDKVNIPDDLLQRHVLKSGCSHTFVLKQPCFKLKIVLESARGIPFSEKPYKLELNDANSSEICGTTKPDGLLEADIPLEAKKGKLAIWMKNPQSENAGDYVWNLQFGELDPEGEQSGVQQRLKNLGLLGNNSSSSTQKALEMFQLMNKLSTKRGLDEETQDKLAKVHKDLE